MCGNSAHLDSTAPAFYILHMSTPKLKRSQLQTEWSKFAGAARRADSFLMSYL